MTESLWKIRNKGFSLLKEQSQCFYTLSLYHLSHCLTPFLSVDHIQLNSECEKGTEIQGDSHINEYSSIVLCI